MNFLQNVSLVFYQVTHASFSNFLLWMRNSSSDCAPDVDVRGVFLNLFKVFDKSGAQVYYRDWKF